MGIFGKRTINKIIDKVAGAGDKIIKNSSTADKQDARDRNNGEGWLSDNIHELVILIIIFTCIFGHKIGIEKETIIKFMEYLGMIFAFLFGRNRR